MERLSGAMKKTILLIATIVMLGAACGTESEPPATTTSTTATTTTTMAPAVDTTSAGGDKPTGTDAKLSSHLVEAADLAADGIAIDTIASQVPVLQIVDGLVLIEITYESITVDSAAAAAAAGLVVSGEYPDLLLITGSAAPEDLRALAALDGVATIQPAFGATTNS
jgi:hypothetical protein